MKSRRLRKMKSHARGLTNQFKQIVSDRLGMVGVVLLSLFIFVAAFAPLISPYSGVGSTYHSDGRLAKLEPPSRHHWFGTTNLAEDVFSQTLMGSRLAILVGLISAICVTVIGTNIGLIAGYFGRWTDEILMRITDIAYGVPFLPFGIVLVALLGASKWNIIIAISVLMWRTSARVVRAQVLSLRERPFIWSAKTAGASNLRILYVHITPNILPLSFLYVALALGWAVTAEASLSFIGLGDPAAVSWGRMLYFAFWAGAIRTAWWWVIPPGVSIGLFVLSCYLIARAYERILNPKLREM